MSETLADWTLRHLEARATGHRARIESAKLIATFVAAIAGTLVATALQVGPPNMLDVAGVIVLGLAIARTYQVFQRGVLDELKYETELVDELSTDSPPSPERRGEILRSLRRAETDCFRTNATLVAEAERVMKHSVAISIVASGVATISLLYPVLAQVLSWMSTVRT